MKADRRARNRLARPCSPDARSHSRSEATFVNLFAHERVVVGLGRDERGATSVVGLALSSTVTVVVASTVAVVAFSIDTDAVADAAEDILDVDDDLTSLLPLVVSASRAGASRDSAVAESRDARSVSRPPS